VKPHRLAAVVCGAALVVGACGGADDGGAPTTAPTAASMPAAAPAPAAAPECGNPVASYEPTSTLPAPGNMPDGTYMKEIQDSGRLVVGTAADVLQFGFRNPITGQIEGFDVDVAHAIANAIFGDPNAVEYKVINYAQRIPSILDGSVDIVAHTMTINCARWEQIAFSTEYYHAGQTLLVGSDSEITSIDDLVGSDLNVCVAEGSTNLEELQKPQYASIERVEVPDLTDCLVLFQQSAVDAITGDNTVMAGFEAQDPFAMQVGEKFTDEPYGLGISHDHPEFVEFVNLVLEDMRADDSLLGLQQEWIGDDTPPPPAVYGREPVG
jgi:polar amino acid transport system substrate-binding protein